MATSIPSRVIYGFYAFRDRVFHFQNGKMVLLTEDNTVWQYLCKRQKCLFIYRFLPERWNGCRNVEVRNGSNYQDYCIFL